jgi:hypothetical protein
LLPSALVMFSQQRAFLLARKREREARHGGRPGGGGGRGGGYGSDGCGYEDDEYDSEDSFIDDDESADWRRHLRGVTGARAQQRWACCRAPGWWMHRVLAALRG